MNNVIDVTKLKKGYPTREGSLKTILDIGHFSLREGEVMAVEGSSGCGKTTFLNIISGILKADSGNIVVAGENISDLNEAERDEHRAKNIGYIFQVFNLLQGFTALENVLMAMRFGPGMDVDFANHLLEVVGLKSHSHQKPGELSVGQQQRVAVARALANKPKLILADEPTGSLDPANSKEAIALIRKISEENKAALLLVSHDRDVLSQFQNVRRFSEMNGRPA